MKDFEFTQKRAATSRFDTKMVEGKRCCCRCYCDIIDIMRLPAIGSTMKEGEKWKNLENLKLFIFGLLYFGFLVRKLKLENDKKKKLLSL